MTDYFAKWCGLSNGSFSKTANVTRLYSKCFGSSGTNSQKYYNLYGAIFADTSMASNLGKFHTGIDLAPGAGIEVVAPINGEVVYSDPHYGTVTVRDDDTGDLFLFLHMTNRIPATDEYGDPTLVVEGETVLGNVGGIGSGGAVVFSPHLHVEVHPGDSDDFTGDSYQTNTFTNEGSSIDFYDYF